MEVNNTENKTAMAEKNGKARGSFETARCYTETH